MRRQIYQILKARRLAEGYAASAIASRLGISTKKLNEMEQGRLAGITDELFEKWLKHLDIPQSDFKYFKQKLQRDLCFDFLSKHFSESNGELISRIADILSLEDVMPLAHIEEVSLKIHQLTLEHLEIQPRFINTLQYDR